VATKTEIINKALHHLGTERIASITDDTKRAKLMVDIYDTTRDVVLEEGAWTFSRKRVSLSKLVAVPAFEWDSQFQKPTDCIKIIKEYNGEVYHEEGDLILGNSDTLQLIYISRVLEEGKFSPGFVETFSLKLAINSGFSITQDRALMQWLEKKYQLELDKARTNNSQNSTPEEFVIDSVLGGRDGTW
jgi:hypothetical protein